MGLTHPPGKSPTKADAQSHIDITCAAGGPSVHVLYLGPLTIVVPACLFENELLTSAAMS